MAAQPIIIGSEASDHISVTVTRREYRDAEDYWDGNWVSAMVAIVAGAFRGEYRALLRADEFASFRDELARLFVDLKGTASFDTMEEWLSVRIVGDGRGHFVAQCEACDQPGIGNRLRFELGFDQTQIPPVLSSLSDVLREFPVKGRPQT